MNSINKVKSKIIDAYFDTIKNSTRNEISIKDVVANAHIARSSFYRNFSSIDDVVLEYLNSRIFNFQKEKLSSFQDLIYVLKESLKQIDKQIDEMKLIKGQNKLGLLFNCINKLFISIINSNDVETDTYQFNNFIYSYISIVRSFLEDEKANILEVEERFNNLTSENLNKFIKLAKESYPVISVKNMRESDTYTIEHFIPSKELMYRAGEAVFKSVNWHGKIAIICGKGNNAGDGYVVAKLLKESGFAVEIYLIEEKFSNDGLYFFNKAVASGVKVNYLNENTDLSTFNILVDCLLGTGFTGEPHGIIATAINKINDSDSYVVSVDINSGLNGDNGLATLAVKSNLTISIGSLKSGLYLNMAKDYIKQLKNADIGITTLKDEYRLLGCNEVKSLLKPRPNLSNKGDYGYLALIGGSQLYSGAIRLSNLANSTMSMGGGVTLLATPKSITNYIIPNILESTIYPLSEKDGYIKFNEEEINHLMFRCKTIAIGMGMGLTDETIKVTKYLIQNYKGNLVIDADGLNAIAKLGTNILSETKAKVILTPHIKEFSRLINKSVEEILQNPIILAKEFAGAFNCIVLLKGPTTIVSDSKYTYLINRGCPGMATAGSGDVLSGILASIVSYNLDNPLLATAGAAYINGLAGELASNENTEISMLASDTARNIKNAIKLILKN